MKILILEYASASGVDDPSISTEGLAMLEGLLDDFKSKNTDYLLDKNIEFSSKNCNCVHIHDDLMEWLEENVEYYHACVLIAPEDDFILYKLTQLLEEKNIKIIGSTLEAVGVCSDKYELYKSLKDSVNIIETEKIYFDDVDNYKSSFKRKKVVKPADGVSCSGVKVVQSLQQLKKAVKEMQSALPYFIVQDFIEGTPASVSLISDGNEAFPLSLNLQNIEFENSDISYHGGLVPWEHKLADDAKNMAKKAVESIKGLKGYVGVDIIIGDEVYLMEINSRLTTPYVALRHITNFNLGEAIFDSAYGIFPTDIKLDGKISFKKADDNLKIIKL